MAAGGARVVGVPCYSATRSGSGTLLFGSNQKYVRALTTVGLAPLLIPPMEGAALAAVFARLDGLLLPGGADVDPSFYGEERLPECEPSDIERDTLELALTDMALDRDLPVFGICRGMQTLNVARGGTLFQDVTSQRPESLAHEMSHLPRDTRAHEIHVEPGSKLAEILGVERAEVNSLHHQAVDKPGAGVRIVAQADDGVAEGMELPAYRFALAVQYHPEELFASDDLSRALFAAFARACGARVEE
ncbi:MAG TPA: gamma-glutamyl-gamma-aminobutyrate hydrolase family protein [Ktedonobacterales bacterium]